MMMMIARVLITIAIHSYVVSASILETTENYYCEEGSQALKAKNASRAIDCEQSWTAESITIGNFINGTVECHSPCIKVTAGGIIISHCINATLTVMCYSQHVTEYRIYFMGIKINHLPLQDFKKRGHYGVWASLTLLLLIAVGLAIQHCICQLHRIRNTRPIQL